MSDIQCYIPTKFAARNLALIARCNTVIEDYKSQGYTLTVRQLYYQMVAKNIVKNNLQSYKHLAGLINDGRYAGLIPWDAIEDRTREFVTRPRWGTGQSFLASVAPQYHSDLWDNQSQRVFVIIEKEALVGVLEDLCHKYDVPLLAARGYPSASVVREFYQDMMLPALDNGQHVTILHLGDHDPSGIDMTRDIEKRIQIFDEDCYPDCYTVERIALNMNQVEASGAPPNPAKITDSRSAPYIKKFGPMSWELDALSPLFINDLVERHITGNIDDDLWEERSSALAETRRNIVAHAAKFKG